MVNWIVTYKCDRLPRVIHYNNEDWELMFTMGPFPYMLSYEAWDYIIDGHTCLVQTFGSSEEEAVEEMLKKLKELGIEV